LQVLQPPEQQGCRDPPRPDQRRRPQRLMDYDDKFVIIEVTCGPYSRVSPPK
jgi:hypothetical protein